LRGAKADLLYYPCHNVPRKIFNSEIYSHPVIWTRLVNALTWNTLASTPKRTIQIPILYILSQCSKCIPQVNTYVAMGKQKYCVVVVNKKYRHLYFPFPNNKEGQTTLTTHFKEYEYEDLTLTYELKA